jgi:hypothetical protein
VGGHHSGRGCRGDGTPGCGSLTCWRRSGESAWLNRPNFPQVSGFDPFPFDLLRFSGEAQYRLLVFELPRGEDPPEPPRLEAGLDAKVAATARDPLEFNLVGELYTDTATGSHRFRSRGWSAARPRSS